MEFRKNSVDPQMYSIWPWGGGNSERKSICESCGELDYMSDHTCRENVEDA